MTPIDANEPSLEDAIETLRDAQPLVQHLTNEVTMNDVANLTLHWGALPVMADSPGDAEEMADLASAMLLNTGQVPERKVEAMEEAAARANERRIPVVLDPVGVGSTPTREAVAEDLLSAVEFAVIKGNYGEISTLAGVEAEVKGVESVGDYDAIEETARDLADSTGAVVVASGVEDVVSDGERAIRIEAGHERLGEVVGTGCMLGATIAAFSGALDDPSAAARCGTLAFGLAGERAAELPHEGPGSYRTNFHDVVAGLSPDVVSAFDAAARIERIG
jgi:hydroxyethylthiazole kinase